MLTYTTIPFSELSLAELYEILQLRIEVFVIEQDCPYQDADDKDQQSYHVCGRDAAGILQAYTRLVPPGISYNNYSSIGRVVNSKAIRGRGEGKRLMEVSVQECQRLWSEIPIKISAQVYLLKFYNSLGFQEIGEEYLEDNIPHIAMVYNEKAN